MRGVDPGPDNVFEVVRAGQMYYPGETNLMVVTPRVEYRLAGSDDLVTKRGEYEFLVEFEPLGGPAPEQYPTQYVTGKRVDGFPWWLLVVLGAALVLS